jgi:hypothetical protein
MRWRQALAVARLDLRRNLFSLRAAPLYLLAGLPVLLVGLFLLVSWLAGPPAELTSPSGVTLVYAHLYQFLLRFPLYAGCVWIFMNLFRGAILDRSLHYYLLCPVRREVLVLGKFLSGWIGALGLFVGSTVVSFLLLHLRFGWTSVLDQTGPLLSYAGVTALACLGYGAVFLVAGLLMRNPIVPALIVWVWEWGNPFLPALLKKISVVFYVQSLLPLAVDEGPFAIVADPAPAWLAVPGLLVFAAAVVLLACLRARSLEVSYAQD